MTEYIYLLQEREFIKTNEPIYKIGKSKQENLKRICNYPNGTRLIFQVICTGCDNIEKQLINIFKDKYEIQRDIGNEYFKGDYTLMIYDIYHHIYQNTKKTQDDICRLYEINTYNDYKRYSSIEDIVITDKNTLGGYIKFKNFAWKKIYMNSTDNKKEELKQYLKNNVVCDALEEFQISYDKIIQDICKECYWKTPLFYELKYYEYLVLIEENNEKKELILNTKDFCLHNCTGNIDDMILMNTGISNKVLYINYTDTNCIDTQIVNDILKSLVNDENKLYQYKQLCYNILVENKEIVIFSDYSDNCHLLSYWLNELIDTLCQSNSNVYNDNERHSYKNKFIHNKPRVMFISDMYYENGIKCRYSATKIKKHIENVKNLGITNIVVQYNHGSKQYNYERYTEYIMQNAETIKDLSGNISEDCLDNCEQYKDMFSSPKMLFNNFLKWCCS